MGAPSQPTQAKPMMSFDPKDVADNKLMAAIGYIGILCLIPLLAKKESRFAQEHGKQGLVLVLAYVALWLFTLIPILGWFLGPILVLILMIINVIALIKALMGEFWEVPLLGKYRSQIKL